MSQRARNLELALVWVDAIRRQDLAQLASLLDPSVRWEPIGQAPGCANREEVLGMFRRRFTRQEEMTVEALELAASESHALFGRSDPQLIELNGVPLHGQAFLVLTVNHGTITHLHSFADRAEARRTARLDGTVDWH